jgi:anti-sigma-K factor RskA
MAERDDIHDIDDLDDGEMAELRALVGQAQLPEGGWVPPPPGLWERIDAAAHEPIPLARRRRSWFVPVAAAAAAVIVVVAALGTLLLVDDDEGDVLATVELAPLGDAGAGSAQLVQRDGTLQLRVDTEDLDPGDGYLELWLIDPTVSRLVSLGPLRDDGTYDLPAHVDPAAFPIVDVSIEPVDGDPTHSGDSVLRGELIL